MQVITPVTHDLGAFKVRRSLPSRERTMPSVVGAVTVRGIGTVAWPVILCPPGRTTCWPSPWPWAGSGPCSAGSRAPTSRSA